LTAELSSASSACDFLRAGIPKTKTKTVGEEMQNVVESFTIIDELPPSPNPWRIHVFERSVVLINPDHPPRVIRNGQVEMLGRQAENPDTCVAPNCVASCASKLLHIIGGKS
jgi:hypothetical protein